MKLTYQADYALRVLLYLAARPGVVVSVGELAGAYGISSNHLAKVAQLLGRLGYVQLLRGQAGGLRLAVDPHHLTVGDVVRATEPSFAVVECFDPATNTCPITGVCGLRGALGEAKEAFLAALDRHTIGACVGRAQPLVALLGVRAGRSRQL